MHRLCSVVLLALLSAGCGSKGAVSLVANVENPSLTVEQAALGTTLTGGFELVLELGEYADGGTDVSLATFGLYRGSQELVSALSLSSDVDFPVRVGPGESRRIRLTLEPGETQQSVIGDALCAAGVEFRGGVTDSANDGKPTAAESAEFEPSCP